MILDTDFLLDLVAGKPTAFEKSMELNENGEPQKLTVTTVFEMFFGAYRFGDEDELRKLQNLLYMYDVIDEDESCTKTAANMLAEVEERYGNENGVSNEDSRIAAAASLQNEKVLTHNVRDFNKLDVDIEEYTDN